eukprot:6507159-Prorocentrum_lima.AAC.1
MVGVHQKRTIYLLAESVVLILYQASAGHNPRTPVDEILPIVVGGNSRRRQTANENETTEGETANQE